MKKKKWHRSVSMKGNLLVLQYLLLGAVIFCGVMFLALETNGLRISDSGKEYLDSQSFANTFCSASWDVAHAISGTFTYGNFDEDTDEQTASLSAQNDNSTDAAGTSSDSRVVDLSEVAADEVLSFTNTSGLAYSLSDLKAWAQIQDYASESAAPIVVCHKASPSGNSASLPMEYYYADDFLKKIDSGEFLLSVYADFDDSGNQTWFTYQKSDDFSQDDIGYYKQYVIESITTAVSSGDLDSDFFSDIQVKAKNGTTLYDQIYSYRYCQLTEHFSPQGADSLLDVLNSNVQWNNNIDEAFDSLSAILSQLNAYSDMKQKLEAYAQGQSNMSYLYINEDAGCVLSDDSDLVEELDYKKSKSASSAVDYYQKLHTLLDSREDVSYILLQTKPDEFVSSLEGLDVRDTFPGNSITDDSWKEQLLGVLPKENGSSVFAAYVNQKLPVSDAFSSGKSFFDSYSRYTRPVFWIGILCTLLFVASFVFLTAIAGRKSTDDTLHLCFFDRWPTELAAGLVVIAWLPVIIFGLSRLPITSYQVAPLQGSLIEPYLLLKLMFCALYTLFWFQIGYLSLVRRIKAKQLWKNSILRRLLVLVVKIIRKIVHKLRSLADFYSRNTAARLKATLAFLGYIFLKYIICGPFLGHMQLFFMFSFFADLLLLFFCITKAYRREQLLKGLKEISGGNLQYKIPSDKLSGDDKRIAEYINNIGSGLDAAVESSVKNERMKTELITNVSHDLKTPLTSIISYIDLLKRENFTDPKVLEYLDILEAKAARLKVLTEDVVEASKASTGNMTLNMTDIDFVEMLHQVIGEFEERFEEHHLTMMVHFPDEPSVIHADGQRMWRVLENIFGNVTKYAMENTRVYAEVQNARNQVIFSLKNISAQPLNFAAEELTERFVRGDVARNTEGSGLGLSIAKSLTELQGGKFQLYLDGDLFKVTITFQARTPGQPAPTLPEQPEPEVR